MALFKILNNFATGTAITNVTNYVQGYCYFDKNTGKFWIDTSNTEAGRVAINGSFFGACSTNANTANKVVLCPGFILSSGSVIFVKFNNTNSADTNNLKLNVNNTGAKPILYLGVSLQNVDDLKINSTYCFVYDGTAYQLVGNIDTNTTYESLTNTEITAGTDTEGKVISAKTLKDFITGLNYSTTVGTVTSITAGDGLTGGTITDTGTIGLSLANSNRLTAAAGGDTNRIYPVRLDSAGNLAVNVPWASGVYEASTGLESTTMNGNPAFRAKLRDLTAASINSVSAEILSANRFYSVITDKNGYLAVNVPWEDNSVHYTLATQNTSGLMSAADKRKLDSLYEADGTGTVKTINTGIGLTGGPITTEGTIKVKLKSETQSSYTSSVGNGDSARFYSVITDADGDLGVIVPWTDTNTNTEYADVTTSTHGLMTAADKVKLNSISAGASVSSVATGVGLEGGTITSSGTIKAKLKNESLLTVDSTAPLGATADRTYAVVPDHSGYLSVYVPWENTEYSVATTSNAGLMSATDKTKLNNIAAGALPGTVTLIDTGVGLTGGPITESGSIKVNLLNETQLRNAAVAATETSGRIYPVALDKNGKLAVNVPWVNDNTEYSAMSVNELKTGTASTGRTMTAANIKSAMTGGIFATGTTNGTFKVYDTEISIAGLGDLAYINKGTGTAKFLREDGSWRTPEDTKYTAGAGLSLTNNQFSIPTNGIKTSMITNGDVTNEKLANSSISIAGNSISLGSSLDAATLISSLGLGSALRFRGVTSSTMSDGYTGSVVIGSSTITPQVGDVVIDSSNDYEYVYVDPYWEKLGSDSSYKVVQTAKTDPNASGTSTSFISTISQNIQGVITATKANLPEASTSLKGIIQITKANTNSFLKLLDTYTDAITDSTSFLRKHATASEYGQLSASALWTYIKDKIGISSTGDTFLRKDGTWATPQDTKYVAATTTAAGLMSAADKEKLDGISANARVGTVTSVSAGVGLLGGPITDAGSIKANLVTETPYQNDAITAFEDPLRLYSVGVDKSGRLAVVVPWANTLITYAPVTQTDNGLMLATDKKKLDGIAAGAQPGTVTLIATNNGIVGGTITETGTIGLNLKSTTKLTTDVNAITDLSNKTYAVSLDKSGYLAVNVPWTDNNTNSYHTTGSWSGITYTATAKGGAEELAFTLPSASTSAPGVVQLSSATNDSSTTVAATASAVKAAYDLAASKTSNTGTVTSVRVLATSPVVSSQNTALTGTLNTTISLEDGYGDIKNPYTSKTANTVLAAPNGTNGLPTFRALTLDDIPEAVAGPASATDGNVALFDGTTGKIIKQGTVSTASVIKSISLTGATPSLGTNFSVPNVTANQSVTVSKVTKSDVSVITAVNQATSTSSVLGTVEDGVLTFGKAITAVGAVTTTSDTANVVTITDNVVSKVTLGTAFSIPNVIDVGSVPTLTTSTLTVVTGIS